MALSEKDQTIKLHKQIVYIVCLFIGGIRGN